MSPDYKVFIASNWMSDGDKMFSRVVVLRWYDKGGKTVQFSTNEQWSEGTTNPVTPNFAFGHYFNEEVLTDAIIQDYNKRVAEMVEKTFVPKKIEEKDGKRYLTSSFGIVKFRCPID